MKKCEPIVRAGMDVDAGAAVRPLGHHARDERHAWHRADAGERWMAIASMHGYDRMISSLADRGGIAFVGGLDIRVQHFAHAGKTLKNFERRGICHRPASPRVAECVLCRTCSSKRSITSETR